MALEFNIWEINLSNLFQFFIIACLLLIIMVQMGNSQEDYKTWCYQYVQMDNCQCSHADLLITRSIDVLKTLEKNQLSTGYVDNVIQNNLNDSFINQKR